MAMTCNFFVRCVRSVPCVTSTVLSPDLWADSLLKESAECQDVSHGVSEVAFPCQTAPSSAAYSEGSEKKDVEGWTWRPCSKHFQPLAEEGPFYKSLIFTK